MTGPPPRVPAWRRYLRFWGRDVRADVRDELQFHIDMRTREYEAQGMLPGDARRTALARFGDVARVDAALTSHDQRQGRAAGRRQITATIASDVRHALRTLRRAPGFTTAAILCLALGTGATASVFAVVNALMFRPLAIARPDNLVVIATTSSGMSLPGDNSYQNYLDIRGAHAVLDGAAAWATYGFSVRIGDQTDLRLVQAVSENYWPLTGVRPVLGRAFTPQEALEHAPRMVIGYRCWQQTFDGSPTVVGRAITVNGIPLTIVGVAPRTFVGAESMTVPDGWVPASLLRELDPMGPDMLHRRVGGGFKIIGRLRDGVTLPGVRNALDILAGQLQHQYPTEDEGKRFVVQREVRARPDIAVSDVVPRGGQRETLDLLNGAYLAGVAAMQPGSTPGAVFQATAAYVADHQNALKTPMAREAAAAALAHPGWALHGLGLDMAEGAPATFESGNVLCYEPLFVGGGQGFFVEDTWVITAAGHELVNPPLPYAPRDIERAMQRSPT
jgi:hypothetical protein